MSQLPILIFTAVEIEARAIIRTLGLMQARARVPHWSSATAQLHIIGIGSVHVPTPLPPARAIILAGLAGGLDPSLGIGDIILDTAAQSLPPVDLLPAARRGPIHTAAHLVSTPGQKAELFAATGAVAVDMENSLLRAQIQSSIEHRHLPFLHIRAISDTAADTLDPLLTHLIDTRGRPKALALAAAIVRHPSLLPHLRRVGLNSTQAANALAAALQALLRRWP